MCIRDSVLAGRRPRRVAPRAARDGPDAGLARRSPATLPLTVGIYQADAALITVGVIVLLRRAVVLPLRLARAVGNEVHERRESTPLVNTTASLLITAGLTG